MITPERREKSRQSRVANRHFRALRARQTRSSPFSALLATGRTIPAGTLPRNAVQSIQRLGIGEAKMEIPDKPDYHARTCRPDGGCGEKRLASERTGGGNAPLDVTAGGGNFFSDYDSDAARGIAHATRALTRS